MSENPLATFSPCRRYRYTLRRNWDSGSGIVMFVGLNPSTADETTDDPTIRRCTGFAKDWGYSGLVMTNLFAYRATKPADMFAQDDPVGSENDAALLAAASEAAIIVACWGGNGGHLGRDKQVRALLPGMRVLKLLKYGQPGHPLYLPGDLVPVEWSEK